MTQCKDPSNLLAHHSATARRAHLAETGKAAGPSMSGPSETGAAGGLAAQGQACISISYGDPRPAIVCLQQRCRWRTCSKPCSCAKKSPPASLLAALWTVKMPSSAPWRPAHLVAEAHAGAKPKAYPRGHACRPCRECAGHGLPACCPPGPCRPLSAPPRPACAGARGPLLPGWAGAVAAARLRSVQAGPPAHAAGAGPLPPLDQQPNASTGPNKRDRPNGLQLLARASGAGPAINNRRLPQTPKRRSRCYEGLRRGWRRRGGQKGTLRYQGFPRDSSS